MLPNLFPNPLFLYRPKNTLIHVLEYIDSNTNEHIYVEELSEYNNQTDINDITWLFSTKNNKHFTKKHFSVRMYFPSTMHKLITEAGFIINNQWGDYNQMKLCSDSKLQIYDLCWKKY